MAESIKLVFYGTGKPMFMIYAPQIMHVLRMFTDPSTIDDVVRQSLHDEKSEFVFLCHQEDEVHDTLMNISHVRILGKEHIQSLYVMDENEAIFVCQDASEYEKQTVVEQLNGWWLSDHIGWWTNFRLLFRCKAISSQKA
jgi:hypothetical protein